VKFAAGTTLINLMTAVAALVRGKLAAVILGTAGVGLYGQVDTFYRGLVQICILSTGAGVTRCVAELIAKGDHAAVRRAFWSITFFSLTLAVAVAGIVSLSSRSLSQLVLGDGRYGVYLAIVAVGLPLQALSDIILGMLVGLKDLRAQVLVTASYTGGGTVLYAILIYQYGIAGAIYSVVGIAMCACAAAVFFLRRGRHELLHNDLREKIFDSALLRLILTIGATGGVMALSERGVLLVFRSIIIRRFGFEANGLYQAIYSLSQLTIAMAFGFVSAYLIPTLSGLSDREKMRVEFSSALRLTLLISTIFSAVMIFYGTLVLRLTYSSAFIGAVSLLRYQALGDFFRALMLLLSATIFAMYGWKPWFGIGMLFYIGYIVFFPLLLPMYGLPAISISYMLSYFVACGVSLVLFQRYAQLSILGLQGPLALRCIGLLALAVITTWVGNPSIRYVTGAIALAVWARLAFTRSEYRRLCTFVSTPALLLGSGER
jgi:PST family polysaccharide transporter